MNSLNQLNWVELLGFLAATLTTASFIPQVWLTWRTRRTDGVSLVMYSIFTTGVACWLAYGVMHRSWPITIANAVTLALAMAIIAMKLRYRESRVREESFQQQH
jgi:MtN3 and saliva related transmembrane protein